jgi:hypothetical protein
MKTELVTRRVIESVALFLIGDGVMGLITPRWHSRLWHFGPELTKSATRELAENPNTARAIYALETAIGIAIASFSTPENR